MVKFFTHEAPPLQFIGSILTIFLLLLFGVLYYSYESEIILAAAILAVLAVVGLLLWCSARSLRELDKPNITWEEAKRAFERAREFHALMFVVGLFSWRFFPRFHRVSCWLDNLFLKELVAWGSKAEDPKVALQNYISLVKDEVPWRKRHSVVDETFAKWSECVRAALEIRAEKDLRAQEAMRIHNEQLGHPLDELLPGRVSGATRVAFSPEEIGHAEEEFRKSSTAFHQWGQLCDSRASIHDFARAFGVDLKSTERIAGVS